MNQTKRVLVTGGAGQVGANLVRALINRGYTVRALDLPENPKLQKLEGLDVEIVEGNLLDLDVVEAALVDVDAVIHTANLVDRPEGMSVSDFFDVNVRSTFNVVEAAARRAADLSRFVHFSSSAAYANDYEPLYLPMDEEHPRHPSGVYGLSKHLGEEAVWAYYRSSGLKVSILRPAGICSGDGVLRWFNAGGVSEFLRSGQDYPRGMLYVKDGSHPWEVVEREAKSLDQPCAALDLEGRPWVQQVADVRDVVSLAVRCLEHPAAVGEAFNAASPDYIPYDAAARYCSERTGQEYLTVRLPVRWVYTMDLSKQKILLGHRPEHTMKSIFDAALAFRRGEDSGII